MCCVCVSRQLPVYNGEVRWQQQCGSTPYVAYSFVSSPPQPAAMCNDYSYCSLLPPPCPPLMGFYQPLTAPYAQPLPSGLGNPVSDSCLRPPQPQGQPISISAPRGRGGPRAPVLPKVTHTLTHLHILIQSRMRTRRHTDRWRVISTCVTPADGSANQSEAASDAQCGSAEGGGSCRA